MTHRCAGLVDPVEIADLCTNCWIAPLDRGLADQKLKALAASTALVKQQLGFDCLAR